MLPCPRFVGLAAGPRNLAWAFANMATPVPSFFSEIEDQAPRILQRCRMPADFSQMGWAAATLGHVSPVLFREIETRAEFIVKDIANTAWASGSSHTTHLSC